VDRIDRLLEVKTRLTTINGYAQLLDCEVARIEPAPARLTERVEHLNDEIAKLIHLIDEIETTMTHPAIEPSGLDDAGSQLSPPDG
jgi:hypothetical protein